MLLAILIILYLYQQDLVPESTISISQEVFKLIAQLFVDDTNLNIKNRGDEFNKDIITSAQSPLDAQHQIL